MAYIECKLKSQAANTQIPMRLYFPTDLPAEVGNTVKGVITLLHGYTNDCDDWMFMSAACRYAADNGLAIVAPSVGNSFYQDMAFGGAYHTFIAQEMPQLLRTIYNLPIEREKNFIAGLSMGGYGALFIGLSHPEQYAACASFSGAVDLRRFVDAAREGDAELQTMVTSLVGPSLVLPETSDLFYLAKKASELPEAQRPRVLCTVGTNDHGYMDIYDQNRVFAQHLKTLPLESECAAWEGVHEWNFWDRSLTKAIGFFLGTNYYARKLNDWRVPEQEL